MDGIQLLMDGTEITEHTIITADIEFFAHWTVVMTAELNGREYSTVQAAVNAVSANNTPVTITILANATEAITVAKNKNITFDLQSYTLSNNGNGAVITNNGTIRISNGTISSTSTNTSAINNNSTGTIIISGGNIIATGARQAVYNDGGTVQITGNAYLSGSAKERATVQNLSNGTMTITGGTIISTRQQAVNNVAGTVTIGNKDGNVSTSSPVLQGATYGLTNANTHTFNYYDGIIKGKTGAISGAISDLEVDYEKEESTEVIDGETYHTAYLVPIEE